MKVTSFRRRQVNRTGGSRPLGFFAAAFRGRRLTELLAVLCLLATALPQVSRGQQPDREGSRSPSALLGELEKNIQSVQQGLDLLKELTQRLRAQGKNVDEIDRRIRRAADRLRTAVSDLKRYENTTYPRLHEKALQELALAADEFSRAAEQFRCHPSNMDRLVLEAAELRVAWSRKALSDLEQDIHRGKLEDIELSVEKVRSENQEVAGLLQPLLED
jgi:hypothetical protein